jgi:hypothetical protein
VDRRATRLHERRENGDEMTNLEQIFDKLEENGVTCFENVIPNDGDYDQVYRESDEIGYYDVSDAEVAWLFTDSIGQALAITRD